MGMQGGFEGLDEWRLIEWEGGLNGGRMRVTAMGASGTESRR